MRHGFSGIPMGMDDVYYPSNLRAMKQARMSAARANINDGVAAERISERGQPSRVMAQIEVEVDPSQLKESVRAMQVMPPDPWFDLNHPTKRFTVGEGHPMEGLFDDISKAVTTAVQTGIQKVQSNLISAGTQAVASGTNALLSSPTVQQSLQDTGKQAAVQTVASQITQGLESAKGAISTLSQKFDQYKKPLMYAALAGAGLLILSKMKRARG